MNEGLWTELEKIDLLRERLGVNYDEAMNALNLAQGDVIKALADLERKTTASKEEWKERGREVWDDVQDKLGDFNRTRINLKRHDRTFLSVSAPVGLALAYTIWRRPGLRLLGLMGAMGAALTDFELQVDREPDAHLVIDPHQAVYSQTEMGI